MKIQLLYSSHSENIAAAVAVMAALYGKHNLLTIQKNNTHTDLIAIVSGEQDCSFKDNWEIKSRFIPNVPDISMIKAMNDQRGVIPNSYRPKHKSKRFKK